MVRETEVKFLVKNFREIKERLRRIKAKRVGRGLEHVFLFDKRNKKLERRGKQLRVKEWLIRPRAKNSTTLKEPYKDSAKRKKYKEMNEGEVGLDNAREMMRIYRAVGLVERFRYTKYRERWKFHGVTIELDTLKDGRCFVEIEATKQHIRSMVKLLHLEWEDRITKGYLALLREKK